MKKKIFGGITVLVIAIVAAWNVNFSSKTNWMSNVMLSNVEALAQETAPSGLYYVLGCSNHNNYTMCGTTVTDQSCGAYSKCP